MFCGNDLPNVRIDERGVTSRNLLIAIFKHAETFLCATTPRDSFSSPATLKRSSSIMTSDITSGLALQCSSMICTGGIFSSFTSSSVIFCRLPASTRGMKFGSSMLSLVVVLDFVLTFELSSLRWVTGREELLVARSFKASLWLAPLKHV